MTIKSTRVDYPRDVGENDSALPSIPILRVSDRGPVAQLGARFHGMEEVVGSIPTRSTKSFSPIFYYECILPSNAGSFRPSAIISRSHHGSRSRAETRAVRDPGACRRGRHGRGLSSP